VRRNGSAAVAGKAGRLLTGRAFSTPELRGLVESADDVVKKGPVLKERHRKPPLLSPARFGVVTKQSAGGRAYDELLQPLEPAPHSFSA
jgi:hypothetical protein